MDKINKCINDIQLNFGTRNIDKLNRYLSNLSMNLIVYHDKHVCRIWEDLIDISKKIIISNTNEWDEQRQNNFYAMFEICFNYAYTEHINYQALIKNLKILKMSIKSNRKTSYKIDVTPTTKEIIKGFVKLGEQ